MPRRQGTFGRMRQRRAAIRAVARIVGLAAAFLLLPLPARAHTVGPGAGLEIELLLVGCAVLVVGVVALRSKRSRPWIGWGVVGTGLVLGALSVIVPQLGSTPRPGAKVAIVSPEDGSTVSSGQPVEIRVAVTGGSVARSPNDTSRGHLHLYLDGVLQQMPYSTTAEVTLKPGIHDITVEYVDPQHVSFDPPILATVELEAGG
jgi:hypothetical protein